MVTPRPGRDCEYCIRIGCLIVVSSLRYSKAWGIANDEGSRKTARRDLVVNGGIALQLMCLLVAVATSYASGNACGCFGPSSFLGTLLGGIVGTAALNISAVF